MVVVSPGRAGASTARQVAVQERPLGTADAVRAAQDILRTAEHDVLVLNGDVPLLTSDGARAPRDAQA